MNTSFAGAAIVSEAAVAEKYFARNFPTAPQFAWEYNCHDMNREYLVVGIVVAGYQSACVCGVSSSARHTPRRGIESSLELYVSPTGSDQNDGTLEHPLATVQKAREVVRSIDKKLIGAPISIIIRGGTYFLEEPIILDSDDSGTEAAPVEYRAFGGEKVVLSGGVKLSGIWSKWRSLWRMSVPHAKNGAWPFRELYVNGVRKPRTRLPSTGHFTFQPSSGESKNELIFSKDDLRGSSLNRADSEVVVLQHWMETRGRVQHVDWDTSHLSLDASSWRPLAWSGGYNTKTGSVDQHAFYVENVFDMLPKQRGAWYLDRLEGILYYNPEDGEDPGNTSSVIAPRLETLMLLRGTKNRPVHSIRVQNIQFSHAAWYLAAHGFSHPQAELPVTAAIQGIWAEGVALVKCEFSHVGGWAVSFGEGSESIEMSDGKFFDIGAGAIKFGSEKSDVPIDEVAKGAIIRANIISEGAKSFFGSPAIWIGQSSNNVIELNEISGAFHFGISVGWRWDAGSGSRAVGNEIRFNDIHNIGSEELGAHSAIYTLGRSPGTTILGNYIHDYPVGAGIVLDNGTTDILVKDNVVFRTANGLVLNYDSRDNVVTNNIFALSTKAVIRRFGDAPECCRGRSISSSFVFSSNIVYWNKEPLFGDKCWPACDCDQNTYCSGQPSCSLQMACTNMPNCQTEKYRATFRNNLYYHAGREPVTFLSCAFKDWQARGFDEGSVLEDPGFERIETGDFSISKNSPALYIGFVPIHRFGTKFSMSVVHSNNQSSNR